MRNIIFLMLLIFFGGSSFAQSADAVAGKWFNKDKDAQIQIYKKGNEYCGKLVWLKQPNNEDGKAKTDVKNPEANLKSRPILGLDILKGLNYNDGSWEEGTVYDPKSGKTYSCKLTLNGSDKLSLRGYLGISIIGRTDVWTRVK